MSLTVEQGEIAGQIAAAITFLQNLLSNIQTATESKSQITGIVVNLDGGPGGQLIYSGPPIAAADSADLLSAFSAYATGQIASLTARLEAIG